MVSPLIATSLPSPMQRPLASTSFCWRSHAVPFQKKTEADPDDTGSPATTSDGAPTTMVFASASTDVPKSAPLAAVASVNGTAIGACCVCSTYDSPDGTNTCTLPDPWLPDAGAPTTR